MTTYNSSDLSEDWEFKILRSMTGAFKNPNHLKNALEEEARSGWVLIEKFDNSRIRLKRPASARERDAKVGGDPYRTYVGVSEGQFALLIVVSVACAIGILLAVIGLFASAR